MQWFVRVYGPERIGYNVQNGQHDNQSESAQLGLVTNGNKHDKHRAQHVDAHVYGMCVDADDGQEHDDEENTARELHVVFGLVVA